MADPLLFDTDVLIDYLRGQLDAVAYLEGLTDPLLMSVVTVAELYTGVREGEERETLETFITVFELVPIDEEIARQSGLFRRDYRKSHNVGLADALIAATAERKKAILVTLNQKHYPMVSRITVPYRKA